MANQPMAYQGMLPPGMNFPPPGMSTPLGMPMPHLGMNYPPPGLPPQMPNMSVPPPGMPNMSVPPPGMPSMSIPPVPPPGMNVSAAPPSAMEPAGSLVKNPGRILPASPTLYISNLNEKIKEDELRKNLQAIFEQFGKILKIVAMKSLKRRGQAFIIFDETESATNALEALQEFPFFEKPMCLNYGKSKSDVIAMREGTFVARTKRPLPPLPKKQPKTAKMEVVVEDWDDLSRKEKRAKIHAAQAAGAPIMAEAAPVAPVYVPVQYEEPNAILFLTGLPENTTELMLSSLFNQFQGFHEVRLVPGREDIAFVEYSSEMASTYAKSSLNGFKLSPMHTLNVSYAKK